MFNVHEVETQLLRHLRRAKEIFDDRVSLAVSQERISGGQAQFSIQYRMMIKNARLGLVVRVWSAEATGMRQLQSHEKSFGRTSRPPVLFDQNVSQARQAIQLIPGNYELVRIGAAFMRHRYRLSSPNEFCAALPEFLPTMDGMLARISIRGSVPPFHWLNCDPVANPYSATRERLFKRRISAG